MRTGICRAIMALALFATACSTEERDAAPPSATATTTTVVPSRTLEPPSTTLATTTSVTTAAPELDLINPIEGTLAGVPVGTGPVEPVLETLQSAFGSPEGDSGWGPNECAGGATTRSVFWANLGLYLEEVADAEVLAGYTYDTEHGSAAPGEVIELPDGIVFGMPYGEGADLYPEGAYTHLSLELDGIMFESPHALAVIAVASPDRSTPIRQVWVGTIPTCS